MHHSVRMSAIAVLLAAACGGGEKKPADSMAGMPAPSAAATINGPIAPAAGGKVIEITMTTDDKGNFFTPNQVDASPGDVLRFKLVIGVHNVNFLADSNPGKTGLPPASALLQLPGQTHDIAVNFAEGTYYWQCDPHAALGMKGHLKVTARK
jgi:plastocyanin